MAKRTFFKRVILTITAVLFCVGLGVGTFGNLSHKSYLAALAVAMVMAVVLAVIVKYRTGISTCLDHFQPAAVCTVISIVCLLVNGTWVLCFRPVQAADYQTFFEAAVNLSQGTGLANRDYIAMFPHILGYAAFLGVFLHIFGQSMVTAAFLNVLLTVASGVLIFILSLRWSGKRTAAAFVSLLWAFCPSKLLYNTMALSEPYYTFLLLLFLLLTSLVFDSRLTAISCSSEVGENSQADVKKNQTGQVMLRSVFLGLMCGVVLALINSARPIGVIPIIAFLIWRLLLRGRNRWKRWRTASAVYLMILLLSYTFAMQTWNTYAASKIGQALPSVPGYSIYVGFNPVTQGSYADEDMELLQSRYFGEYNRNADAAQRSMLDSAKVRILETKKSIPGLMVHKLGTLLGHDEGGAFYSSESLTGRAYKLWCIASNIWYYYVSILAAAGGISLWNQKRGDSLWLVPLSMTGVILAQLLVEVAARYHYSLIPLLLLLASISFYLIEKPGKSAR